MSQRDSAAIYVGLLAIKAEFLLHREILSRERLIHLDEIDLVQRHSCFFECCASCWYRSAAHDARIDTGNAPTYESSKWLEASFLRFGDGHQHYRGPTINDAAGISGGDGTVLAE